MRDLTSATEKRIIEGSGSTSGAGAGSSLLSLMHETVKIPAKTRASAEIRYFDRLDFIFPIASFLHIFNRHLKAKETYLYLSDSEFIIVVADNSDSLIFQPPTG